MKYCQLPIKLAQCSAMYIRHYEVSMVNFLCTARAESTIGVHGTTLNIKLT